MSIFRVSIADLDTVDKMLPELGVSYCSYSIYRIGVRQLRTCFYLER